MWYSIGTDLTTVCNKCNMVMSFMTKSEPFCPKCLNGIEELKEKIKKAEESRGDTL